MLRQMVRDKIVKAGFDTNVFNNRPLLEALLQKPQSTNHRAIRLQLYLSPIVLTELSVKLFREGWEDSAVIQYLQEFPFQLIPYTEHPTFAVAHLVVTEGITFRDHARDLMIGAQYLTEECIIVSDNIKHFTWATLESATIQKYMVCTDDEKRKDLPQLVYTPNQFWTDLKPYFE